MDKRGRNKLELMIILVISLIIGVSIVYFAAGVAEGGDCCYDHDGEPVDDFECDSGMFCEDVPPSCPSSGYGHCELASVEYEHQFPSQDLCFDEENNDAEDDIDCADGQDPKTILVPLGEGPEYVRERRDCYNAEASANHPCGSGGSFFFRRWM